MWIKIVILIILLMLSAFFSGSETAFMSLGKFKYKEYIRKKKKNYRIVQKLKSNPHKLLSTILIGNNLVNIAAASLATIIGAEFFLNVGFNFTEAASAGIVTGVMTIIVLIFGEIIPKTYSNFHYNQVVARSAYIVYVLSIVFTPLIFVLDIAARFFTKGKVREEKITEEEIKTMVNVGSAEGGIDKYEQQLIQKIFQFDDKTVHEIMTPRVKVYSLSAEAKIKDVLKEIIEEGYSRVPIYQKDADNIVGIFHIRDVLHSLEKRNLNQKLRSLAIKPLFVPQSKQIDSLFREMQRKKRQIAIVVDEFGGFAGVVTLEDLLEEIVGEIYDEDEVRTAVIRKLSAKEFRIKGEATLREIKESIKISLNGSDSENISAYVMEKLGRIPKKREKIKINKAELMIEKVTEKSIESVKLRKD